MKNYYIYHHDDSDGRCSAYVVADALRKKGITDECIHYFEIEYAKYFSVASLLSGDTIYFVDYSFNKNTHLILQSIMSLTDVELVWIDHHHSSMKLMSDFPVYSKIKGLRSEAYSGAWLCYAYMNLQDKMSCINELKDLDRYIPAYVKFVSDYDTWTNHYKETNFFKLGLEAADTSPTSNIWKKISVENKMEQLKALTEVITNGKVIKSYVDQFNQFQLNSFGYESRIFPDKELGEIVEDKFGNKIENCKCYVVNCKTNSWVFGNKINEYTYTIPFVFNGEKFVYSIFSIDDTARCDLVAGYYGGGGHKGAAGFSSDHLLYKKN